MKSLHFKHKEEYDKQVPARQTYEPSKVPGKFRNTAHESMTHRPHLDIERQHGRIPFLWSATRGRNAGRRGRFRIIPGFSRRLLSCSRPRVRSRCGSLGGEWLLAVCIAFVFSRGRRALGPCAAGHRRRGRSCARGWSRSVSCWHWN